MLTLIAIFLDELHYTLISHKRTRDVSLLAVQYKDDKRYRRKQTEGFAKLLYFTTV